MPHHKTIIFDLGKVLVPFDFQLGYRAMAEYCPHPAPEIRRRIAATGLVARLEKGLIEPREFVERLCAALEVQLGYEDFRRVWGCIFSGQLIPDHVLKSLAARYRLLLLSNTNFIHFETIQAKYATLLQHFHDLVLSFEVHAMKPEPEIYQAVLERAGCSPEECFYTDDISEFVEAARREGIDSVQFESPAQLEREMNARGIVW